MLKCSSPQLWLLSKDWGEEGSVIFKGLATGSLTILQWIYGQHELDLVYFFSFFSKWFFGVGWTWDEWETSVIRVYCVKFPNNKKKYYVEQKERKKETIWLIPCLTIKIFFPTPLSNCSDFHSIWEIYCSTIIYLSLMIDHWSPIFLHFKMLSCCYSVQESQSLQQNI